MNHDQADELRQLARQRFPSPADNGPAVPLVVASGGKGGVGTTTIAVNLAVAFARQGRRAVFVDADLDHGGNAQLGHVRHRGSVLDVLAGRRTVHEVLERGPAGIQLLSGAWASGEGGNSQPAAQERLIRDLKNLSLHADVVVVDAGNGRGAFARRLWEAADLLLVVTTPQPVAIMECYAAVKVLSAGMPPHAIHTLVNLCAPHVASQVHARITETCRRFLGLRVVPAGEVLTHDTAADPAPIVVFAPASAAARALDSTAERLWTQLQTTAASGRASLALSA